MSLHFESDRVNKILNELADIVCKYGNPGMARKIGKLRELYEDMVQPRDRANIRISGTLLALLQHEIQSRELIARGYSKTNPLIKTWTDEIENMKKSIAADNLAPKFRSGVYFDSKKIDELSRDVMISAKQHALNKLSSVLKAKVQDFKDSSVKNAKSAADLGIAF